MKTRCKNLLTGRVCKKIARKLLDRKLIKRERSLKKNRSPNHAKANSDVSYPVDSHQNPSSVLHRATTSPVFRHAVSFLSTHRLPYSIENRVPAQENSPTSASVGPTPRSAKESLRRR